MTKRTIQIKLVAIKDVHLKQGQEIDAAITLPNELGSCTTQIHDSLVVMAIGLPNEDEPTGRAAILATKKAGLKDSL